MVANKEISYVYRDVLIEVQHDFSWRAKLKNSSKFPFIIIVYHSGEAQTGYKLITKCDVSIAI
jgi:hypothetical protein